MAAIRLLLNLGVLVCFAGCADPPSGPPSDAGIGEEESAVPLTGREKGIADAKKALAAGTLKLKEYPPLPYPPGHLEYVAGLRKQGIEYEVPKQPEGVSEKEFIEEVLGWNEVMRAAIQEKLGPDVLK